MNLSSNIAALVKTEADNIVMKKAFVKNKYAYQAKRTFIIGEVKALMPQLLFMSMAILPVIMNLIVKASKKRSQIHPGGCYEHSKKNRNQENIHSKRFIIWQRVDTAKLYLGLEHSSDWENNKQQFSLRYVGQNSLYEFFREL